MMFEHHTQPSQHSESYDPSEDILDNESDTFRDSTLSYPSESYALLSIPSSIQEHLPNDDRQGSPQVVEEPQSLSSNGQFTSPYHVRVSSILALVAHTVLLVFSWTFFIITITEPVPLSVKNAIEARSHMQSVTTVVTLIASGISLLSTIAYGRAVQNALARLLATKLSLYSLYVGFNIAKPSAIINFTRPGWMIASIFCVLAVNAQTAGYSILLTPKVIVVKSNMIGYELDLKSSDFQKLMDTNAALVTANMFPRVLPVVESSGGAAISSSFSLPGILTFNHFSYFNSTRGILPVIIDEADSKTFSEYGTTMPVNVKVEQKWATPPGFPASFSMTQQGFTTQVACRQLGLNDSLKLGVMSSTRAFADFGGIDFTTGSISVSCPNSTDISVSADVLTSLGVDAVFAISCPVTEANGRRSWDLVLTGNGRYSAIRPTVCSIYPQVHTVTVIYNGLSNSSSPKVINGTDTTESEDAPWLGDFALSVFLNGLNIGQSPTRNAMGDTILTFMSTLPNSTDLLSNVLSQYVRGVLELSGTLLRTVYTQNGNGLYTGGASIIPPSMRIATNGTYSASTVGWHQATETAFAALVAPTCVSLVSILIVVFMLVKKGIVNEPDTNRDFNPCEILHIISAASAGGMQRTFPPFHENNLKYCESAAITLAPVEGGNSRTGFIDVN